MVADLNYLDPEIPPIAKIEGVDLVTEGVITISRVLEYAKDYITDNESYSQWATSGTGLPSSPGCSLRKPRTSTSLWAGP